ncbi:MAG: TIM-barrel domain-containing protein [Rariglobus sp.]
MLNTSPYVTVSASGIAITGADGARLADLSLNFQAGAKTWSVTAVATTADGWLGMTDDPEVIVKITRGGSSVCVELTGPFGPACDVAYFVGSRIAASHAHAFITDANHGTFPMAQNRVFTLTNQAAMRQRLGLKEELWMLAPQPHVIGFGAADGAGFSFSIPECLPSDAVQFALKDRTLRIDFLHHVAACDGNRMPRVYIDLGVASKIDSLDRHLKHARELGLVVDDKRQPAWWHNPLYCTWGDQCRLGLHGVHKDASLTRERILAWADKIRTFYDGEVNFIIDDGYFLCMGDFRLRPELYATVDAFRELIAELKRRNFRVILWYTPFWVAKQAASVAEHPEWILHRPDGTLLDETGDWKNKHHYDWTHPELREHQRTLIRHFLVDLNADGFKIDMTYAHPPSRDVVFHDPSWGAGNLMCKRVVEFIHAEATAIKPDVFLTVNGVECYLQPYTSAVRLNDLFNMTDATAWYHRAGLVNRLMPGVAIDVDGWPAALSKLREYPFVASVFGAPVSYYLDGTEVGDVAFGDAEINRMASVWATYAHAPLHADDRITIDVEAERFERRDAEGRLRAMSLLRRVFVTYADKIRVTANSAMAVAVPLEAGSSPKTCTRVSRDGTRTSVALHREGDRALFFAADAADGVLYYELG